MALSIMLAMIVLLSPLQRAAGCMEGACVQDEMNLMQQKSVVEHRSEKHVKRPGSFYNFWGHRVHSIDRSKQVSMLETANGLKTTDFYLNRPSSKPYNLQDSSRKFYSQWGQDLVLEPILTKIGPGFFVESGALNGETDSNTLMYELHKNWTGLLIEPNPDQYPTLISKNRRAWAYNGCLAPDGHEELLRFDSRPDAIGVSGISDQGNYAVQAQPLEALLKKVDPLLKTVDFWSLDIEGSESAVLQSTNFSNVEVGVMLIEMNKNEENNAGIMKVMNKEGFQMIRQTYYNPGGNEEPLDGIFVNPKYFEKRNLNVPTAEDVLPGTIPWQVQAPPAANLAGLEEFLSKEDLEFLEDSGFGNEAKEEKWFRRLEGHGNLFETVDEELAWLQ